MIVFVLDALQSLFFLSEDVAASDALGATVGGVEIGALDATVGVGLGAAEGALVGALGATVGVGLGAAEGAGLFEGASVGRKLGVTLGITLGAELIVGDPVPLGAALVGLIVG